MKIDYLITFTKDRLPFYPWKINTLITWYNHDACHTFTRSSVWQREKRQVNKSDFSRSARPTGLLSLSWKRMQDDTRNRLVSRQNSYPPERCERFCEHSSSSLSLRVELFDPRSISILFTMYLEQLYNLDFYSAWDRNSAWPG